MYLPHGYARIRGWAQLIFNVRFMQLLAGLGVLVRISLSPAGKYGCQGPQMRWRVRRGVLIATQKAAKEMLPALRVLGVLRVLQALRTTLDRIAG